MLLKHVKHGWQFLHLHTVRIYLSSTPFPSHKVAQLRVSL